MGKEALRINDSLSENRMNILLLEGIHPAAGEILKAAGFNVEVYPSVMTEDELIEKIRNIDVLGIRSMTHITPKVLGYVNTGTDKEFDKNVIIDLSKMDHTIKFRVLY